MGGYIKLNLPQALRTTSIFSWRTPSIISEYTETENPPFMNENELNHTETLTYGEVNDTFREEPFFPSIILVLIPAGCLSKASLSISVARQTILFSYSFPISNQCESIAETDNRFFLEKGVHPYFWNSLPAIYYSAH